MMSDNISLVDKWEVLDRASLIKLSTLCTYLWVASLRLFPTAFFPFYINSTDSHEASQRALHVAMKDIPRQGWFHEKKA